MSQEPLVPDAFVYKGDAGSFSRCKIILVHAHNQHFFVVRSVENPDAPSLGQAYGVTPEKVVVEFLLRGLLEGENLAALRIYS